jgi:phosphomannomutase
MGSVALKVSVSGIRGIVGQDLDAVVAARWATAFGAWLPAGPVVVGRDTRPSGDMLLRSIAAALMSTGHPVWDIGVATTPTTEVAVAESDAVGGVIITASHNPQPWNAMKFIDHRGLFLTKEHNRELRKCYDRAGGHVPSDQLGSCESRFDADHQHLAAILCLPWLDRERIATRGLSAVVDAVEGAGGRIAPALLKALGVRCIPLHCGLSGQFPHDPEPTPAHLDELCRQVTASGADVGFALDPDGDRLALVDANGHALSEELTLVLASEFLLNREQGPVVVNLSTTQLIEYVAERHGVTVERTPVGEANVVEAMLATAAVIGGEGNGGVIYPALHAGRDALIGITMILQSMADQGQSLADIAAALPPTAMVKEKVAGESLPVGEDLAATLAGLGSGTIDDRDGLKWTGHESWVHVRPSNTEPVVRIIAEAKDEATARALIERVQSAR